MLLREGWLWFDWLWFVLLLSALLWFAFLSLFALLFFALGVSHGLLTSGVAVMVLLHYGLEGSLCAGIALVLLVGVMVTACPFPRSGCMAGFWFLFRSF